MNLNPVFVNEMRQSIFRRKPFLAVLLWILAVVVLQWIAQAVMPGPYSLSWAPILALPLIAPVFTAGAFAKEYEQQTWQDLYLTRLSNAQVVLGKFCASALLVWLVALSFVPPTWFLMAQQGKLEGLLPDKWTGMDWWFATGWWMIVLAFKLLLSGSLYVLLAMVCSRYSHNRRMALVWSYIALFLYGLLGTIVWTTIGMQAYQSSRILSGSPNPALDDALAPSFMQGVHLIFCSVVGVGSLVLLWVSLSEQRGYRDDVEPKRAWQPRKG
ncbi:MAG TPA: hypothetical protein VFA07_11280 [Chthonomonadaceae bacterium]|nr:hypothetical protein [Chthonomonadaceae bacterium]